MVGILKRSLVNTFARFSSLRKERREETLNIIFPRSALHFRTLNIITPNNYRMESNLNVVINKVISWIGFRVLVGLLYKK